MPKAKTHRPTGFHRPLGAVPNMPGRKLGARKGITAAHVTCGECGAGPDDPCISVGIVSEGILRPHPSSKVPIGTPITTFHKARYRMAQRERNKDL